MRNLLNKLLNGGVSAINRLNDWIGYGVSWLTTVLVVVVCADVLMRYCFGNSQVAVQELQWHLFAVIFLLGSAYTLRHDKHVRVDVFYARLSPRWQAMINLVGALVFVVPFTLLVIWASHKFVLRSIFIVDPFTDEFRWVLEGSPNPGGLPGRYVLKAMIPLASLLLLLQGLAMAGQALLELLHGPQSDSPAPTGDASPAEEG